MEMNDSRLKILLIILLVIFLVVFAMTLILIKNKMDDKKPQPNLKNPSAAEQQKEKKVYTTQETNEQLGKQAGNTEALPVKVLTPEETTSALGKNESPETPSNKTYTPDETTSALGK